MASHAAAIAHSSPFGARFVLRVVNALETLVQSVVRWNEERQTRIILMSLSDEILADIGAVRPISR